MKAMLRHVSVLSLIILSTVSDVAMAIDHTKAGEALKLPASEFYIAPYMVLRTGMAKIADADGTGPMQFVANDGKITSYPKAFTKAEKQDFVNLLEQVIPLRKALEACDVANDPSAAEFRALLDHFFNKILYNTFMLAADKTDPKVKDADIKFYMADIGAALFQIDGYFADKTEAKMSESEKKFRSQLQVFANRILPAGKKISDYSEDEVKKAKSPKANLEETLKLAKKAREAVKKMDSSKFCKLDPASSSSASSTDEDRKKKEEEEKKKKEEEEKKKKEEADKNKPKFENKEGSPTPDKKDKPGENGGQPTPTNTQQQGGGPLGPQGPGPGGYVPGPTGQADPTNALGANPYGDLLSGLLPGLLAGQPVITRNGDRSDGGRSNSPTRTENPPPQPPIIPPTPPPAAQADGGGEGQQPPPPMGPPPPPPPVQVGSSGNNGIDPSLLMALQNQNKQQPVVIQQPAAELKSAADIRREAEADARKFGQGLIPQGMYAQGPYAQPYQGIGAAPLTGGASGLLGSRPGQGGIFPAMVNGVNRFGTAALQTGRAALGAIGSAFLGGTGTTNLQRLAPNRQMTMQPVNAAGNGEGVRGSISAPRVQ